MLRHALLEFEAKIDIIAVSPLLIKDGRLNDESRQTLKGDRKKMPNAIPISRNAWEDVARAVEDGDPYTRVGRLDFYIPGSSLKGAWRAHLERTLRGLTPESDARVCDPLDDDETGNSRCSSCSKILEEKKKEYNRKRVRFPAYAMSCPICRLFGNTVTASRLKISDGSRTDKDVLGRLVQREHVAINRKNGQVTRGPLKFYGLQDARFSINLTLRNYELQQLMLIGVLLSDLLGMRVPLGSGKSKGYGQVKAEIRSLGFTAFSLEQPDHRLLGTAEHPAAGDALRNDYRWTPTPGNPQVSLDWKPDTLAPCAGTLR